MNALLAKLQSRLRAYPGTPDLTGPELETATEDYQRFMEEFTVHLFESLKPPFSGRSVHLERFDFLISMDDYMTVYVKRRSESPVTLESLAPRTEDLLREAMNFHGMCIFCGPVNDPLRDAHHAGHFYNRVRDLLNRIDNARKAAT